VGRPRSERAPGLFGTTLSAALRNRNGKAFCASLTPAGQSETLKMMKGAGVRSSGCSGAVQAYLDRVKGAKPDTIPVRTKKVTVGDSTAKVTITGGLAGDETVTYTLAKENARWKVVDPFSANPTVGRSLR
jgi:hypothetical protein